MVRKIGEIAFGLYACVSYLMRHGDPAVTEGCPGHQLTTRLTDEEGSAQSAWLADNAARAHVTLKTDSYETQLWAASCGGGLALLPRFRADAEPALRRITTAVAVPSAEIWVGVHDDNRRVPRVLYGIGPDCGGGAQPCRHAQPAGLSVAAAKYADARYLRGVGPENPPLIGRRRRNMPSSDATAKRKVTGCPRLPSSISTAH